MIRLSVNLGYRRQRPPAHHQGRVHPRSPRTDLFHRQRRLLRTCADRRGGRFRTTTSGLSSPAAWRRPLNRADTDRRPLPRVSSVIPVYLKRIYHPSQRRSLVALHLASPANWTAFRQEDRRRRVKDKIAILDTPSYENLAVSLWSMPTVVAASPMSTRRPRSPAQAGADARIPVA